MRESNTGTISFSDDDPAAVLLLLEYLYTGSYGCARASGSLWKGRHPARRFQLQVHVGLIAERLLLDHLRLLAVEGLRAEVSNISHWSPMSTLILVYILYSPDSKVIKESQMTKEAKQLLIDKLGQSNNALFDSEASYCQRERLALHSYPEFLLDLATALRRLQQ